MTLLSLILIIAIGPAEATDNREYELLSSTEVIQKALNFHSHAVAELGERRERSAIPVLRKILAEKVPADPGDPYGPATDGMSTWEKIALLGRAHHRDAIIASQEQARIALAKLGDEESIQILFQRLSSEKYSEVMDTIYYLGRIDDKRVVKHLIPYLRVIKGPEQPVGLLPLWDCAEQALCINQPVACERIYSTQLKTPGDPRDLWLKWWEKNKKDFEK